VHNPIVEKHLEAIRKKAQQVDNVAQIIDTDCMCFGLEDLDIANNNQTHVTWVDSFISA